MSDNKKPLPITREMVEEFRRLAVKEPPNGAESDRWNRLPDVLRMACPHSQPDYEVGEEYPPGAQLDVDNIANALLALLDRIDELEKMLEDAERFFTNERFARQQKVEDSAQDEIEQLAEKLWLREGHRVDSETCFKWAQEHIDFRNQRREQMTKK